MSKDTQHTRTADQPQLELPAAVTVAVAELASAACQGLLALAVGMALQVLQAMLDIACLSERNCVLRVPTIVLRGVVLLLPH